jgi:outer membrane protein TolC
LDLQIRSQITQAYNDIGQYLEAVSLVKTRLVTEDAAASLAKAQYNVGQGDQLAMISAQMAALQDRIAVQTTELAQRLKYAELQNLSAGTWHWAP